MQKKISNLWYYKYMFVNYTCRLHTVLPVFSPQCSCYCWIPLGLCFDFSALQFVNPQQVWSHLVLVIISLPWHGKFINLYRCLQWYLSFWSLKFICIAFEGASKIFLVLMIASVIILYNSEFAIKRDLN